jgi:hypothetical protein
MVRQHDGTDISQTSNVKGDGRKGRKETTGHRQADISNSLNGCETIQSKR